MARESRRPELLDWWNALDKNEGGLTTLGIFADWLSDEDHQFHEPIRWCYDERKVPYWDDHSKMWYWGHVAYFKSPEIKANPTWDLQFSRIIHELKPSNTLSSLLISGMSSYAPRFGWDRGFRMYVKLSNAYKFVCNSWVFARKAGRNPRL